MRISTPLEEIHKQRSPSQKASSPPTSRNPSGRIFQNFYSWVKLPERWIRHCCKGGKKEKTIISIPSEGECYAIWMHDHEPQAMELEQQRAHKFTQMPKISILVPLYNTPSSIFKEMVASVVAQTYFNWELCLAVGGSRDSEFRQAVERVVASDSRIQVVFLGENRGIAGNTNAASDLATGEFIALLDHDDTLAPFAVHAVVSAINHNHNADVLYSDEDKLSEDGKTRRDPHFKPDFGPDTLRSHNYICHLTVVRKLLFNEIGRFRDGFDGSQDYDLILRATERARHIVHIPQVLYHWRMSPGSMAQDSSSKAYCAVAGKKAVTDHLQRLGMAGEVLDGLSPTTYQVRYKIPKKPFVSIIIPNKDNVVDLQKCIQSILSKTTWKCFEILIIENHSQNPETFVVYKDLQQDTHIHIIHWTQPFNYSAINNYAAKVALGEFLLFLNNDTEVISPNWIERMLEHAQRPDVGVVGAMLYYPNDTVQHAGVIVGIGGLAGHSHRGQPRNALGYFGRMTLVQNLSAVTFACVLMRKTVFEEMGGLEESYCLAFNDIDFCMKVREKGYLVVWTPHAELYHFESKTRGYEDTPDKQARFKQEIRIFHKRWGKPPELLDPYYNPNLSLMSECFEININKNNIQC